MHLPFRLPFGKKEVKSYYLALLLEDEMVRAIIFEESTGQMALSGQGQAHFPTSLEEADFEELLDTIDKAVSLAESTVPENIQTQKTIFAVKQDWTTDGKIKKEFLVTLKKVCEELALEPIGFLVFTEAIIHLLQKEEGAPISAILVEIGKKFITTSILRAGRTIASKQIAFTDNIPETVDTVLKHFENIEILPARIVLFDTEGKEKLSQQFISHAWSKSLPFLHMPQITVLPPGFETKGVLFGIAAQMEFSVRNIEKIAQVVEDIPQLEEVEKQEDEKTERTFSSIKHTEEEPQELSEDISSDYFGFVKNKDVTSGKKPTPAKNLHSEKVSNQTLGQTIEEIPEEVKEYETRLPFFFESILKQTIQFSHTVKWKQALNSVIKLLQGIFKKRAQTHTPMHEEKAMHQEQPKISAKSSFHPLFLIIPLLLLVAIGTFVAYVFGMKAVVTITVTPNTVQATPTISFVTNGTTDAAKNTIAASAISADEKGSGNLATTGTKQVGTNAKGQVTIFSRLSDTTTLSAGTIVTASNNLLFTLDTSVTIASFSGDTTDPSVTISNIGTTAKDIGPESNLPSGTKFTIKGQSASDISAKNDNPFNGGTKKDIRTVAQADVDTLTQNIIKNNETQAKSDLEKQIGDTKQLLPLFIKEDIGKKTLSKNVGDEASSVSIDTIVSYTSLSIDKNDLTTLALTSIKGNAPAGTNISQKDLQLNLSNINTDKQGNVSATLAIKAFLLPTINTADLTNSIAGKSFVQAKNILGSNQQVDNVTIQLSPAIPFLPKLLPRISQHIQIHVVSNE